MADVTACLDRRCPSRVFCYRFTCQKDGWQSYFKKSPRKAQAVSCNQFWDNTTKHGHPDPTDYTASQKVPIICDCNLYGMKHKRNESCEVFEAITQPSLRKMCTRKGVKKLKIQVKGCKKGKSYPKGGRK